MLTLRYLLRVGGSKSCLQQKPQWQQFHDLTRFSTAYNSRFYDFKRKSNNILPPSLLQINSTSPVLWWANTNLIATNSFVTSKQKCAGKSETKSSAALTESDIFGEASKLGLFAKFKMMYKKYWYVLIPVHVVTSIGWFGGFYYLSKSGVDIPALLQHIQVSESIIDKLQHSDMGHLAIAYLCYKIATPLRYAVTLGGTTVSIKYLVQAGHIKPMPSKIEFMKIYARKRQSRVNRAAAAKKSEVHNKEQPPK